MPPIELTIAQDVSIAACDLFERARPRTVALSGGSTPAPVYSRLATLDFPWEATHIFFGDERCVAPDHPDSNFRMAWEALLSKVPAVVHRMPAEDCDATAYERELAATFGPGMPQFDLVFLGLGTDGHTASLFPGDAALNECERRVVRVERPDHSRLTLTLPVLSAARLAIFLVTGAAKRAPLAQLLRGDDIPAAWVRAERILVIADDDAARSDAASLLTGG